ncbi:MAG: hypothetical protein U9Q92_00525 [archaeon]|nr:hypothetical protein [archaeon]
MNIRLVSVLVFVVFLSGMFIPACFAADSCGVTKTDVIKSIIAHITQKSDISRGQVMALIKAYLGSADCGSNDVRQAKEKANVIDNDVIPRCSDGTLFAHCSSKNKPKYCYSGSLVDRCDMCCESGRCGPDGGCEVLQDADGDAACTGSDKPRCCAIGSRSEGWYQDGKLIKWDNCGGCYAVCKLIGSRSEGWYSSCDNELIQYDQCGISCRDENYPCSIEDIPCCSGLKSSALFGDPNGDCSIVANCGTICIPCGNRVCDANEGICNCPEDCKEDTQECHVHTNPSWIDNGVHTVKIVQLGCTRSGCAEGSANATEALVEIREGIHCGEQFWVWIDNMMSRNVPVVGVCYMAEIFTEMYGPNCGHVIRYLVTETDCPECAGHDVTGHGDPCVSDVECNSPLVCKTSGRYDGSQGGHAEKYCCYADECASVISGPCVAVGGTDIRDAPYPHMVLSCVLNSQMPVAEYIVDCEETFGAGYWCGTYAGWNGQCHAGGDMKELSTPGCSLDIPDAQYCIKCA